MKILEARNHSHSKEPLLWLPASAIFVGLHVATAAGYIPWSFTTLCWAGIGVMIYLKVKT